MLCQIERHWHSRPPSLYLWQITQEQELIQDGNFRFSLYSEYKLEIKAKLKGKKTHKTPKNEERLLGLLFEIKNEAKIMEKSKLVNFHFIFHKINEGEDERKKFRSRNNNDKRF